MPIRITGMNSGLDTESIITALTQQKKDRVDKLKGDQTKLTWKQDKWKELNKKVASFYNGTLANMRFSSAYSKKTTTASKESAVSIVTGSDAMNTMQSLDITRLAKAAYLTGKKAYVGNPEDNKTAKLDTTIEDLGISVGDTIDFRVGDENSDQKISVTIEEGDTVEKILGKLKQSTTDDGTKLDFSFDQKNGRFFVASQKEGDKVAFHIDNATDAMKKLGLAYDGDSEENASNYIAGSSATIKLNGVEYTSENNVFEVNGLTITAKEVATGITISTKQDTSGIYDNIKNMLKEYNDLMKEISTAYTADKAKKYSMLTDDQKDEMSDKEVEEWEKKIKDGLLSGDETLGSIRSGLRSIANMGFDIKLKDGTTAKYNLSDFGIGTGSYFTTKEEDRETLHIDGDKDDSLTSANADKLSALISSDPDAVSDFFTQFSREMYGKLSDLMKGSEFKTAFTIYEDKLMASQYSSYNTKISDAQKALEAAQDKLYKKFSVMETALAKTNSASGSLSGFFGG